MSQQVSLLSEDMLQSVSRTRFENLKPADILGQKALRDWKQRIAQFQAAVKVEPISEQGSLLGFDGGLLGGQADAQADARADAETIDPFALAQQNTEFWRWQFDDSGVAALYFVIDYEVNVLLYVGETVKSNQRWKGEHDCKRYLMNYREAHYLHEMGSQLGIAFWPYAPTERRARQRLESALIRKWRAPFNKENWEFWGTPFVGEKVSS
jgi:GIY-YIG catalytic domain